MIPRWMKKRSSCGNRKIAFVKRQRSRNVVRSSLVADSELSRPVDETGAASVNAPIRVSIEWKTSIHSGDRRRPQEREPNTNYMWKSWTLTELIRGLGVLGCDWFRPIWITL